MPGGGPSTGRSSQERLATYDSVWRYDLIRELAHEFLKSSMALPDESIYDDDGAQNQSGTYLVVIRTVISFRKPRRLCIRDLAQFALDIAMDDALFALDNANLQTGVLGLGDDVVTVETIKCFRRVLSRC